MKKLGSFLGLGLILFSVLFFTFYRLRFSFLNQDEGYYLSLVYRLALGDRFAAFAPTDFFAYLIFPITSLYLKVFNFTTGLILFSRIIYWLFTIFVSSLIFWGLSQHLNRQLSLILCLIYPCYLHYFPVLFYTNLAMGFLTSALFLSLVALKHKKQSIYFGVIGALLGLAGICHPGGIPFAVLAYLVGLKTSGHQSRECFAFLTVGFLGAIMAFFVFSGFSLSDINRASNYYLLLSRATAFPPSVQKAFSVLTWINECNPLNGKVIFLLLIPIGLYFSNKKLASYFLSLIFIPMIYVFIDRGLGSSNSRFQFQAVAGGGDGALVRYISILGLAIYFLIRKTSVLADSLFKLVWLPSFAAAFGLAFTSNTLMGNIGIGCMPAFICSAFFLYTLIQRVTPKTSNLAIIPVVLLLLFLIPFAPLKSSSKQSLVDVYKGPYAGMKADLTVKQLNDDLTEFFEKTILPTKGRIFINGSTLVGYSYLYTKLKPGVPTTWGCFIADEICKKLQEPFNDDITTLLNFNKNKIDLEPFDKFELKTTYKNIDMYEREMKHTPSRS